MSIKKSVGNVKGFTLVELLIVVAIIGVLASQGVPAYRRMIQKSRKGEAQNMLGNIAMGESAFFADYGTYGNNLARMGVALDGYRDAAGRNYTYAAGVDTVINCQAVPAIFPAGGTVANLDANNPLYFQVLAGQGPVANTNFLNLMGRLSQTVCVTGAATTTNTFMATASGYIRGGTDAVMDACLNGWQNCDQWTMTQDRQLRNSNDGISF